MIRLNAFAFLVATLWVALHSTSTEIVIGVILNKVPFVLDYLHFKPSVDIAIDTINTRVQHGDYLNMSMSYVFRTTDHTCGDPKMKAPGIASDIYHNYNVSAFFGPLCSGETAPVADLCAHWNIPILSGASTSGILDNKNRFATFTRASYKVSNLVDFMVTVFKKYNWKRGSIIWDSTQAYWRTVLTPSLLDTLGNNNVTVLMYEMNSFDGNIKEIMTAAVGKSRSEYKNTQQ